MRARARAVEKPKASLGYPRRADQVVCRVLDGKGVLMQLDRGGYFEINPVGLAMWEACDGKTSTDRIATSIAKRFGVGVARVERDLADLIVALETRKLLTLDSAPARPRHR